MSLVIVCLKLYSLIIFYKTNDLYLFFYHLILFINLFFQIPLTIFYVYVNISAYINIYLIVFMEICYGNAYCTH